MSLVELIGQADERGLAASGLACLDRCVPLLGGDDEVLRPLWAGLADDAGAEEWGERLEQVRGKLGGGEEFGPADEECSGEDEAVLMARRMLAAAPVERSAAAVREWADTCSVAALRIHRLLDPLKDAGDSVDARREGRTEGMSPLVAAELRRQITVLELLAGHGPAGLRPALEVSTEGRRVLRAVVSRRSRRRG
ncbi:MULTISPECIES: hypothetical protein [unclassified Streptomyces]|uniref:hypothetical protein n=1 Tax=unclassified Streptomyces TaxID=2593676 RepID=UPI001BAED575|nr:MULTISPECIES: hypothetical protein [unclassified Streptomyces]MDH6452418.1 hypothetical protein [Streptomyces sp. SAI-119]MDH6497026.1 hypothetical protein [Streptomyces sp. SAI-149]QUC56247.1 hypothetical protein IOD14_05270 [Streptomyces sp. A2-16]